MPRTKEYRAAYYVRHKQRLLEKSKKYRAANKEKVREYNSKYYSSRRCILSLTRKKQRELAAEKLKHSRRLYYQTHKAEKAASSKERSLRKKNRSPVWANKFFIDEAYILARVRSLATGIEWHVDHIVPIHGELVSGLHVEFNLQVIPSVENIRKSNSFNIMEYAHVCP